MKIEVINTHYDYSVPNGSIMTVTHNYGGGDLKATIDGGDGFEWCMLSGSYRVISDARRDGDQSTYGVKREVSDTPTTGTLRELKVKPGDVVELVSDHGPMVVISATTITSGPFQNQIYAHLSGYGSGIFDKEQFRIISRASDVDGHNDGSAVTPRDILTEISKAADNVDFTPQPLGDLGIFFNDTPTVWQDMTGAEKGALLLAHHDGRVIEGIDPTDPSDTWGSVGGHLCDLWIDEIAYRIKPEPKRETVSYEWNSAYGFYGSDGADDPKTTHRITFDTIDGKPDVGSIKMQAIT